MAAVRFVSALGDGAILPFLLLWAHHNGGLPDATAGLLLIAQAVAEMTGGLAGLARCVVAHTGGH